MAAVGGLDGDRKPPLHSTGAHAGLRSAPVVIIVSRGFVRSVIICYMTEKQWYGFSPWQAALG